MASLATIRAGARTLLCCGAVIAMMAARAAEPAWVQDPALPGAHLPPVGQSLFDEVFTEVRQGRAEYLLPFPFEALLARLDGRLAADPASRLPPAKRVLIPLGRSLQRSAAAPDYFHYPRVVVAVDSPAAPGSPLHFKDRLYIGYQEKSAVLEVISYNEAAGRFEFQLVKDYRAGATPRVYYANRNICFACHQNGAPIFSRALWDETNANPQIAVELARSGRRFYGIAPERGVDMPYAIDAAVRRANRLALAQRLWREGCGGSEAPAQHCRAGLFEAALKLRLADGRAERPDDRFADGVAAPLLRHGTRLWPDGLALGRPDLPNRNPLQGLDAWPGEVARRVARSHVPARFEPLLPRPPEEVWRADGAGAMPGAVAGVGDLLSDGDLARVAAALARRTKDGPRPTSSLACRFTTMPASRLEMRCASSAGADLLVSLDGAKGRIKGGRIERLSLAGEPPVHGVALTPGPDGRSLRPSDRTPLRMANGDVLEALEPDRRDAGDGGVKLHWRADGAVLREAVTRLAATAEGAAALGDQAFPRAALVKALLSALGAADGREAPPPVFPAARLELPATAPNGASGDVLPPALQRFHAWCAACHLSAEQFPPNFLHGPSAGLEGRITQCAPRIFVRLAMADRPAGRREKTPMPPETLLPAFGSHAAAWAASPERKALLEVVVTRLKARTGRDPDVDSLLAAGYEALPPCLAPGQ